MTINFFKGHPSNDLLASQEVVEATQAVLGPSWRAGDDDDEDRHPLTYGSDPGSLTVRRQIVQWANNHTGSQLDGDWINLTNGASYGLANALLVATSPHTGYTRRAFVVSPTYFLVNSIFLDAGFAGRISPIDQRGDGSIDLDRLEELLKQYDTLPDVGLEPVLDLIADPSKGARTIYRYVMYLVPDFSNPRGTVIPLSDRQRLLALARKHNVLLLCDDVYRKLNYSGQQLPPSLVTLDRETLEVPEGKAADDVAGNTISNCTFSKIIGPGLRVGWQETPSKYLQFQLCSGGAVRSGGTPAHLNSMLAGAIIDLGLIDTIVARLRTTYKARVEAMRLAFAEHMPKGTTIEGGDGGYFFWLTLPPAYDGEAITKKCSELGVVLAPAKNFQVGGDPDECALSPNSFRVCFAYHNAGDAVEGIKIWGEACQSFKSGELSK